MSGLVDAVVIVAVVALVLARQLRPQAISGNRKWWVLPAVLVFVSLRQSGVVDPHHEAASVALLAAEVLVGVGMGAVWAYTTRIWRDDNGTVWSKGTKATAAAWIGAIAIRFGLAGAGMAIGVHQGSGATMLALAATLLVRSGGVVWRARELQPAYALTAVP
ncbi:DUF1453 family protein [Streptomyces sp. RB6PN25]|uniref:DUF1453 family protein n=1 Tax=Streptomyces humicola TaxID=2953240 RepID=A0ABT1PZD7_9ACTN|nr:CcdC protein domain-containing protein [Streptomyces humicola]MCQ4082989.1 DUF1453 family protein [Streptomyces humicola]